MKRKLNIGCGKDIRPHAEGWDNLDRLGHEGVELITDLDSIHPMIPVEPDTYEELHASHVLEHINHILPCMQELHRVAKPDAKLYIQVPHGATDVAFEDPTHVRQFFPRSFGYFGQPYYHLADYGYRGDWYVEEITLILKFSPQITEIEDAQEARQFLAWLCQEWNKVHELQAVLRAVKPIRAQSAPQERPQVIVTMLHPEPGADNGRGQ